MPTSFCPHCETPVDANVHHGLCPKCLLAVGLSQSEGSDSIDDIAETFDSGSGSFSGGDDDFVLRDEPREFAEFELIDEIARGGMGVVYLARHRTLGREVALKVILSGQFASDNDVRRFQLEAESAASLDHPGIVPIYEVGQHDGNHFFTMKLISGGSLADRMSELRRDTRELVRLLADVADAMHFAHQRGILHRDIKPANILIDENDRPVVTDLGLAKRTGSDSDLTGTGAIVGTPAYMPPEQASASKEITTSADIYAIGAILYEGLTGRPPHQGESAVATLMLAAKGQVQPPSEIDGRVDRTLELICMKCLQREPDDRYASSGGLAKDLNCWLRGESVSVRPKSFANVLSDLLADQLRSAIGAIAIGILGGLATGIPLFAGLADHLLGSQDARFNVARLKADLPTAPVDDAWWLHLPDWLSQSGFLIGLFISLSLGWCIRWLVRPTSTRQALAVGLVAGLLMTIVQFGMYGVGAVWNTFAIVNANEISLLSEASVSPTAERDAAVQTIYESYPELADLPTARRGEVLGQLISLRILLSIPPVFVGCLCLCLAFSTVSCVAGTVHAQRLSETDFHWTNRVWRYIEVMVLLLFVLGFVAANLFFLFGMVTENGRKVPFNPILLIPLALLLLASVPAFRLSRWYIRWPVFVTCSVFAIVAAGNLN